ncbi:hypothetical protein ACU635_59740 [[Actinomadura] parvosata]|uniref:hypothetical protein n=1 Tax=[Actinomadura] parvosata TaxID=1955412 RepID=UPI00406D1F6D
MVGVGSDTTEVLFGRLASDYNRFHRNRVASYWATGVSPITPKPGCAPITRPNGSPPGAVALVQRGTPADCSPCVDFARSLVLRSADAPADSVLYAIALDGLAYAVNERIHAPAQLSTQQVIDILECDAVCWDQVGGSTSDAIEPYLPDRGPGLEKLLQQIVGIERLGPCVGVTQQADGTTPEVKNNPNALVFSSIGKHIGQTRSARARTSWQRIS